MRLIAINRLTALNKSVGIVK